MVNKDKALLRQQILAQRPHSSAGITERLEDLVALLNPKLIASFQPLSDEPDIASFNKSVSPQSIVFPRIVGDDLVFAAGDLAAGSLGIMEPQGDEARLPDLILVPALAVDHEGNRLGRGKGFYDRTLIRFPNAKTYAVVFDPEVFPSLPIDSWDAKVNGFVTPSRTVTFD